MQAAEDIQVDLLAILAAVSETTVAESAPHSFAGTPFATLLASIMLMWRSLTQLTADEPAVIRQLVGIAPFGLTYQQLTLQLLEGVNVACRHLRIVPVEEVVVFALYGATVCAGANADPQSTVVFHGGRQQFALF